MDLVTPDNVIIERIQREYAKELNKRLRKSVKPIKKRTQELLKELLNSSDTFGDLQIGLLRHQLGIPDPQSAASAIIQRLCESVEVIFENIKINSTLISGGITVRAIVSDFSDILSLPEASYINEADTEFNGLEIKWLDWLLTKGNEIVVHDYTFVGRATARSRTDFGIMRKSSKSWAIDSQHSGTIQNNFITRAIPSDLTEVKIGQIIEEEIKKLL